MFAVTRALGMDPRKQDEVAGEEVPVEELIWHVCIGAVITDDDFYPDDDIWTQEYVTISNLLYLGGAPDPNYQKPC